MLLVVLAAPGCSASAGGSSERASQSGSSKHAPPSGTFEYALPINHYELTEAELGRALDLAQDAGVGTIAAGASWWHIAPQPSPESQRWDSLDLLVEEVRRRGMKVNLQVSGTPDWVHPNLKESVPDHDQRVWYPPRGREELGHFTDFVRTLVGRYGTLAERYEIWNEPNNDEFWRPAPEPAEYATLLRNAYLAANEARPGTTIVFGGLVRNDVGYLDAYYSEAKEYPDAAGEGYFFDVMDVHPYSSIPSESGGLEEPISPDRYCSRGAVFEGDYGEVNQTFLGVKKIKSAMDEQGDTGKFIYLGEYGFSTTDTWMKGVPDYRRALYLKRAYALARALPYVEGMSWYAFVPSSSTGEEWTILDSDLNLSTTYRALKQATRAEEAEIAVSVPRSQEPVSGVYSVKPDLTGVDETDASGWELYTDGSLVGSYDDVPLEWDTRKVEDGAHSLMLAMYTKDGSVWSSNPIRLEVRNAPEGLMRPLKRVYEKILANVVTTFYSGRHCD